MSITLTPDTESRLREHAARMGQDADTVADVLLANALADQQDESLEALTGDQLAQIGTGIRRGLAATAEGRERPIADYATDVKRRRANRAAGALGLRRRQVQIDAPKDFAQATA